MPPHPGGPTLAERIIPQHYGSATPYPGAPGWPQQQPVPSAPAPPPPQQQLQQHAGYYSQGAQQQPAGYQAYGMPAAQVPAAGVATPYPPPPVYQYYPNPA